MKSSINCKLDGLDLLIFNGVLAEGIHFLWRGLKIWPIQFKINGPDLITHTLEWQNQSRAAGSHFRSSVLFGVRYKLFKPYMFFTHSIFTACIKYPLKTIDAYWFKQKIAKEQKTMIELYIFKGKGTLKPPTKQQILKILIYEAFWVTSFYKFSKYV